MSVTMLCLLLIYWILANFCYLGWKFFVYLNGNGIFDLITAHRERSGSVVECLTPDRGTAGLSLTGVTALCP